MCMKIQKLLYYSFQNTDKEQSYGNYKCGKTY